MTEDRLTKTQQEDVNNYVITNHVKNGLWRYATPHELWLVNRELHEVVELYIDTTTDQAIRCFRGDPPFVHINPSVGYIHFNGYHNALSYTRDFECFLPHTE